jgi:flagellar biosynthesis/type III secretory pathway protein FliH
MREQAVSLGMTIAEVMVRRALDLDPGLVVDAVDSAIAELGAGDGQSPTVRMCPSDLERLAELEDIQFPPDGVTTLPDESLEPGDCVAELDGYLADARLTPRLAAIRAHLDTTSAGDS